MRKNWISRRESERKTHCLRVQLGHPVLGDYKYGDLAIQVEKISFFLKKTQFICNL
jgi:23S rRNA-/tRNA-specific pseudouridylate synthase